MYTKIECKVMTDLLHISFPNQFKSIERNPYMPRASL